MDPSSLAELLRPDTLFFYALFVVPGWMMLTFYRRYVPSERRDIGSELLAIISLSLLNFAIAYAVLLLVSDLPLAVTLWLPFAVAVLPTLLAYLYTWWRLNARPVLREEASKEQEAPPVPPIPTAFDAVFGSNVSYIVRFRDPEGRSQAGYFGRDSHSSPFPNEQQLYLEELLVTDEHGEPTGRHPERHLRRGAITEAL